MMGWKNKKLEDVCRLINGRAYKKNEMLSEGPYPLLRVGNFFTNRGWYYSDLELDADKYCDTGDLLYAWSASFGPRIWDGGKVIYHYHIWKIEVDSSIVEKKYLYYLLDWDKERIKGEQGAGATMVHVTKGSMEKRVLPFPLLSEQKRIVDILDQTYEQIEQARAKTEKNLKNGQLLFESYLQNIFSQRSEGWIEKTLGTVADFKNGLNFSQGSKGEKIKIVGVKDFRSNFRVPSKQLATVQIDGDLAEAYELKEGDIITVRSNGNKRLIGRCLLKGKIDTKTSNSGFTIRIRLFDEEINPEFLAYYMKSSTTHEWLISSGEGANISNLNQKTLSALPIAYPREPEQTKYLCGIERVEREVSNILNVYERKLLSLEELKKSILQKAFSGELTSKDAEGAAA
jgi:type I restriction enzyme S subunit